MRELSILGFRASSFWVFFFAVGGGYLVLQGVGVEASGLEVLSFSSTFGVFHLRVLRF